MTDDPSPTDSDALKREEIAALKALTAEIHRFNEHRFIRIQNSPGRLLLFQLFRGAALGLGTLMGATVLVSLMAWWASQFSFIPIIGEWMIQIVDEIDRGR